MQVMQQVADAPRGISIAGLVEVTGLPKSTIHRITSQLDVEGYLRRSPVDKRFVIGKKLQEFSLTILSNASVGAPCHAMPFLKLYLKKLAKPAIAQC